MIRKIQIGSYILEIFNIIQIIFWISGGYGKGGLIDISTRGFFMINTLFPALILIISIIMIIFSKKKLVSALILLACAAQTTLFILIIILGILMFG
jgi:hypothetical protein